MSTSDFALKRSVQPYVGLAIILLCVTVLDEVLAFQERQWKAMWAMPLAWLFFVGIVAIGTRYRIWWRSNGAIVQRAANYAITTINVDEITGVQQEVSDLQTLVSLRRPFRRIAIYAEHPHGIKFIDISLKHFVAEDIRKLMRAIHEERPDLVLPKNWS